MFFILILIMRVRVTRLSLLLLIASAASGRERKRRSTMEAPYLPLPTMAELYPPELHPSVDPNLIRPVPDAAGVLQRDIEKVPGGLQAAAAAQCSPSKQLVLLTADERQLDIGVNLIANLAAVGIHHREIRRAIHEA